MLLGLLIMLMNIFPAFMPPTWTVLAFFYAAFDLRLVPIVIIGAVCATLGRIILANLARYVFKDYIPKSWLTNYHYLGSYFKKYQKFSIPIMLTYAFFPVSSNDVYIIAGLSDINLRVLAVSFFIGRLFSYTVWVSASYHFSKQLGSLFTHHLTSTNTIIFEIIGIFIIVAVGKIKWQKFLK
jgi:membrane protein DedA with SNARE-associated domain